MEARLATEAARPTDPGSERSGGRAQEVLKAISQSLLNASRDKADGKQSPPGKSAQILRELENMSIASGESSKTLPTVSSVNTAQIEQLLKLKSPGVYQPPTPGLRVRPMPSVDVMASPRDTPVSQRRKASAAIREQLALRFPTPPAQKAPLVQASAAPAPGPASASKEPSAERRKEVLIQMEQQLGMAVSALAQEQAEGRERLETAFQKASDAQAKASTYEMQLVDARKRNEQLTRRFKALQASFDGSPSPNDGTVDTADRATPNQSFDIQAAAKGSSGEPMVAYPSTPSRSAEIKNQRMVVELTAQALKSKVSSLESELRDSRAIATRRAATLAAFEKRLVSVHRDFETQKSALLARAKEEQARAEKLQKALDTRESEAAARSSSADAGAQLALLQRKFQASAAEATRLREMCSAKDVSTKAAREALQKARAERDSLQATVRSLQESQAKLSAATESRTSVISQAVDAKVKAEAAAEQQRERVRELESKLAKLQVQPAAADALVEARDEVAALTDRVEQLTTQKREMSIKMHSQRTALLALRARISAVEDADQNASPGPSKETPATLVREMMDLQQELQAQRVEARRLRKLVSGEVQADDSEPAAAPPAERPKAAAAPSAPRKTDSATSPVKALLLSGLSSGAGGGAASKVLTEFKQRIDSALGQLAADREKQRRAAAEAARSRRDVAPTAARSTRKAERRAQLVAAITRAAARAAVDAMKREAARTAVTTVPAPKPVSLKLNLKLDSKAQAKLNRYIGGADAGGIARPITLEATPRLESPQPPRIASATVSEKGMQTSAEAMGMRNRASAERGRRSKQARTSRRPPSAWKPAGYRGAPKGKKRSRSASATRGRSRRTKNAPAKTTGVFIRAKVSRRRAKSRTRARSVSKPRTARVSTRPRPTKLSMARRTRKTARDRSAANRRLKVWMP